MEGRCPQPSVHQILTRCHSYHRYHITGERLYALAPAAHPPLLYLGVRVVVKLYPILRSVRPLVWVPVRHWRSLELCRHRLSHRIISRTLLRPVGKVKDRLVEARGHLRRRRPW